MKVLKFGGTSVGSVEGLQNIKKIIGSQEQQVIVVVSAMSGVTDSLIKIANLASNGDDSYGALLNEITQRHFEIIKSVVDNEEVRDKLLCEVGELFEELNKLLVGVHIVKDISLKTLDIIVSYGERVSSLIVSSMLNRAPLVDSRLFIKTQTQHGKHIVDFSTTNALISDHLKYSPNVIVVPGFIASNNNGETTNLGRGGSDYTASIIASALNAEILEIWTDVDGFMSADPKIINSAYVIDRLSYIEAMELCNFGAKIIFPPTLYPVFHSKIPIRIKNTFNPNVPGSLINDQKTTDNNQIIKGISSIGDTALITVHGLGMVGVIGVNYRIFKALAKGSISVFMVAQASSENTTTLAVRTVDADEAASLLSKEFEKDIAQGEISDVIVEKGLATVAIVGEDMKERHGIAGKLFDTLGRNGINVVACAEGALGRNLSFVIKRKNLHKALTALHDSFFLSEYQTLNLILAGVGAVGHSLLLQIEQQQSKLLKDNALRINVVGISNSKQCIFDSDGISISNYKELLQNSTIVTSPEVLRDNIIEMNLPNSVFVDCTANENIAGLYLSLLSSSISVVTANKIAASSSYENYIELKKTAIKHGVKFLFETNVGAGLPIINTINSLINSGDKIQKIEAVLSGTLNYIFNTISRDVPFSQTVKMAQEAGFAEPDPRIDLSGIDVIRKLVIISRESGYKINQEDVKTNLFLPDDYFTESIDEFFQKMKSLDHDFEARRQVLEKENRKWRFCAKMEEGKAEVGLIEVGVEHPFFELEGSNNIILLTTGRYKSHPMMIQGFGAGAEVTSAGVFADIISIANVR